MDVSLVLTHRCNLACGYCYAGDHHLAEMTGEVRGRAVELLVADGAELAQLGFFGGEPFLAFAAMKEAAARARVVAAAAGCRLIMQATTNGTALGREQVEWVVGNGVQVCVSIDGVREAHERGRPLKGGRSSFDAVVKGLRALVDAGAGPDALMVITPATVGWLAESVTWLWNEGVDVVRANLDFTAEWEAGARVVLREQLLEVGAELVRQRREGREVSFAPLADAIGEVVPALRRVKRPHVVVATSGNLYPCSPMVGEDRDDGPEAALRIGHLSEPFSDIVKKVFEEGLHCSKKGECACASYMETGDMNRMGSVGADWKRMKREVGLVVGRLLGETAPVAAQAQAQTGADADATPDEARNRAALALAPVLAVAGAAGPLRSLAATSPSRTRLVASVMVGASALGFVSASAPGLLRVVKQKRACAATATAADVAGSATKGVGGMSVDGAALAGMTLVSQEDADEAALRARIAAKAAQQVAVKPRPKKPKPPDHHFGGVMIQGDMEF
ncbi:MAG: radical SAM protein [Deltaproteobacteria bacterium]|nr:radical SAM protein [Deltaproteobacteria bacterium]